MLVRSDLFATIGGFDQRIADFEEHLDLCWRVQIAGGRVLVVPTATVTSLERMSAVSQPLSRRHSMRSRQHIVAKCYGWVHLVPILILAMVLSFLEVTYSLLALRFRHARDVFGLGMESAANSLPIKSATSDFSCKRNSRSADSSAADWGFVTTARFLQGQIGGDIAFQSIRGRAGRRVTQSFSAGSRRIFPYSVVLLRAGTGVW